MLACVLHAVMALTWLLATMGAPPSLRWVSLAFALPALLLARLAPRRRAVASATLLPLACLVGWGLLRGTASSSATLAVAKTFAYGMTALAGVLGGTAWVERFGREGTLRAWRWTWRVLLVGAVGAYAAGAWRQGPEGLYGPTGNPNMFGSILATFGLVVIVPSGKDRMRWLLVEGLAFAVLLLATRARASFAAALAATTVSIALGTSARRWVWVGTGLTLLAGTLLAFPDRSVATFSNVAEGATVRDVLKTRTAVWEESWDAMVDGLPLGFGWGVKRNQRAWEFDVKTLGFGREEGTSWLPIGEELGIPGLVFVGWLWIRLAARTRSQPRLVARFGASALALYFVLATFEGWFLSPGNWESMAFWTTLGIAFAAPRGSVRPDGAAPLEPPRASAAEREVAVA